MVRVLLLAAAILCLTPLMSSASALLLGVVLALAVGNPFLDFTRRATRSLLSFAIIGMGAGMNLEVIFQVGAHGVGYTFIGITATLFLGLLLRKFYQVEKNLATLIAVGTAICGGSAIAAVAPVIKAKHYEISVALGTVFILNAVALFLFPPIGQALDLSQSQFGLWSALAIHDTSSVVGASMPYGSEALQIGTTVKLARALWIIPVTLLFAWITQRSEAQEKIKTQKPWFILGFCLSAALVTWIPELRPFGEIVSAVSKQLLVLTLYLIGLNLTKENIKAVGVKPFLLGLTLWILSASLTLIAVKFGLIFI